MNPSDEQYLEAQMETLSCLLHEYSDSQSLVVLVKAASLLRVLERISLEKPAVAAPFLEQLKEIADDIRCRLLENTDELAALYEGIAVRRNALEKAALRCRTALVEICFQDGSSKVLLGGGAVRAVRLQQIRLPGQKTPQREELVGVLKNHGYWDQVSTLSGPRLKTALNSDLLAVEHRELIADLYKFEDTYQLTPRKPDANRQEDKIWALVESAGEIPKAELESDLEKRIAEAEAAAEEWEELAKDAYAEGYEDAINDKEADWLEFDED